MAKKKKIYQYSLEGEFIREFSSVGEVNEFYPKLKKSNICAAASGTTKHCGGWQWKYVYSPKIDPVVTRKGYIKLRAELIYDDRTDFIINQNKSHLVEFFRNMVDEPGIKYFQIKKNDEIIYKADIKNGQLNTLYTSS